MITFIHSLTRDDRDFDVEVTLDYDIWDEQEPYEVKRVTCVCCGSDLICTPEEEQELIDCYEDKGLDRIRYNQYMED